MASDRGTPPRKKDHILQVTILDVNDNPPVIESPFGYNVSVNEVKIPRVDHGQKLTMRHPFKTSAWPTGPSIFRTEIMHKCSPSTQPCNIFFVIKQRPWNSFFFITNVICFLALRLDDCRKTFSKPCWAIVPGAAHEERRFRVEPCSQGRGP